MKWVHPLKGNAIKEVLASAITQKIGLPIHYSSLVTNLWFEIKWEGYCSWASMDFHRADWNLHSWDTMRDCCKHGFDILSNGEVSAKHCDWQDK